MKILIINLIVLIFVLLFAMNGRAGTCTSINYTSVSAGDLITSSKYNTDNTTLFNNSNAYDGGCITSNTIEDDALSTTDFYNLYNGFVQGCEITRASSTSLSIDKCMLSVNSNFVRTTTATTVDFTDLDIGSATGTQKYFIYADSSSSGTTLTPVVSIATPDGEGYNSNDKVLGFFYNNSDSEIASSSISQWADYKNKPTAILVSAFVDLTTAGEATLENGKISNIIDNFIYSCHDTTPQSCYFATGYWADVPNCWSVATTTTGGFSETRPCTNTNPTRTTDEKYTFFSSFATGDGTQRVCGGTAHQVFCQGIKN